MKKALYYAIRTGSLYNPVVAVTTEKQHRWHGREVRVSKILNAIISGMPTHGVLSDLSGRFEHVEDAIKTRDSIAKVADSYDEARKLLARESSALYAREREAMAALLRGEPVTHHPWPQVTYTQREIKL
jgi:hypothetical protein